MKPLVIYHDNCMDGHTAAWVAARALGDVELYPAQHGTDPPDVTGREVLILDFSYKRPVMERLIASLGSGGITVLDHHMTAAEDLAGLPRTDRVQISFDMERSGAGLAWDFFHAPVERPWLVNYVEDGDLWSWVLPDSRLVNAAIGSYPRTLEAWDTLAHRRPDDLVAEGVIIERYRQLCIEAASRLARLFEIGGHWVPAANSSEPRFASETAHLLCEGQPFAATYYVRGDRMVQFSLRSRQQGLDVSQIAARYGGGGHPHAAGFQVSFQVFAAMLGASRDT